MQRSIEAVVGALLAIGLCGCAEIHHGAEAVSRVESSAVLVEETEAAPIARPDIKTIRPLGTPRVTAADPTTTAPATTSTIVASEVPTPREIFDFHPAGSAAGSFRQPFIIDPNDGPLTADVRRTAAELKAFNAAMKSSTAFAGGNQCNEMDVAHDKPGCAGPKPKVASTISHNPLSLQ